MKDSIQHAVKPKEIVKASNNFFRIRCKMKNLLASRIVMAFASLVDESDLNENKRFLRYQIAASSIIGDIKAGGEYYSEIREAAYILMDQKLEQRKHKNHFKIYTLFSTIEYENGTITGELHSDILPFFVNLKKQFTKITLNEYLRLPSVYSQKIFGYLSSWGGTNSVEIPLSELHFLLDTPESFRKNFKDFRRWCLEKSHSDILKYTSFRYDWMPIKNGRAVSSIRFIFKKEENEKRDNKNKLFLEALNCAKEKKGCCIHHERAKEICEICDRENFCKTICLSYERK